MQEALIDKIYECAFAPEGWPEILDQLAHLVEARGGIIGLSNTQVMSWAASPCLREMFEEYVAQGWHARSTLPERLFFANPHAGFVVEHDMYTEDELRQDEVYRDFIHPRGLGWGVGFGVPAPTGDAIILTLQREYGRGPVERHFIDMLDPLRPHLARSALMSARFQLERAQTTADTLARIGLPAIIFDARGKALAANSLAEQLTGHFVWKAFGHVSLHDPAANELLQRTIMAIDSDATPFTRSFPVRAKEAQTMVAHVVPTRRTARDILIRCAGVVTLTPVTMPEAPPVELVRSLFDLTPAEARVARALATGKTVQEIALAGNVSESTVRSQIKNLLSKTGCGRQVDIVKLLGGVSTFDTPKAEED